MNWSDIQTRLIISIDRLPNERTYFALQTHTFQAQLTVNSAWNNKQTIIYVRTVIKFRMRNVMAHLCNVCCLLLRRQETVKTVKEEKT